MAQIQRFSEQVVEMAERLADVADAAEGHGNRRKGMGARWLVLPAAGAGLYALVTSRSFPRQAKGVLQQAKARASDLPDDLFGRVQQATGLGENGKTTRRTSQTSATRKSGGQRKRKAGSAR